MIVTILVSTSVSQPDVVSSPSNLESGCKFRLMHNPAVCRVKDTMLEIYHFLSSVSFLTGKTRDSEHS